MSNENNFGSDLEDDLLNKWMDTIDRDMTASKQTCFDKVEEV